jgi:hypothetical protein
VTVNFLFLSIFFSRVSRDHGISHLTVNLRGNTNSQLLCFFFFFFSSLIFIIFVEKNARNAYIVVVVLKLRWF